MRMSFSYSLIAALLLTLFGCDRSCDGLNPDMRECKFGCMDSEALNFDPEATIGTNSCSYFNKPATINFVCGNEIGGPINLYLECRQIGAYLTDQTTITSFGNFECGDSLAASIKMGRTLAADDEDDWEISYYGNDTLGNDFEGAFTLLDGECRTIQIDRQSPGRVLFYARDFSDIRINLLFTGWLEGTEEYASIYFNNNPSPTNCDDKYTFELPVGSYRWEASENGFGDLDLYEGTFEITSGSCEIISLKE